MTTLRDPKEIVLLDEEGKECRFFLSKFYAWDGSEILERYPAHLLASSIIPRLYDAEIMNQLKAKIMRYVAVKIGDNLVRLETPALINNHVPDALTMHQLMAEEVKYNNRFFRNGTLWDFLKKAAIEARPKISEILTQFSASSATTTDSPPTS